jgi:4-amino-4-deoxy-L-arabinose transferase-like glycosyltransferase
VSQRDKTIWGVVIVVSALLRLAIVTSYAAPAGDGHQYYRLSQALIAGGRFAYGESLPPTWTRLPGYPLFLAAIVHERFPLWAHLVRATRANALLDVGSALLIVAILRRRGARLLVQALAYAFVILCPPLVYLSCYGLSESLATFLFVLEVYFALRTLDGGHALRDACLAGFVAGLAQLTRVDAVTALPAVLVAVAAAKVPWHARLQRLAAFALVAALTFAPWPLRNLHRFGALHWEGSEWLTQTGEPEPTGLMQWMRSWSGGEAGGRFVLLRMSNRADIDTQSPYEVLPRMYDSPHEYAQVVAMFRRYNVEGLSPTVDRALTELAAERAHSHRLRQNLVLPAERLVALWTPLPESELPMVTVLLHLPEWRHVYDVWLLALMALALPGAIFSWRRDRTLALALLSTIAFRSLVHARFAHPCPTQRYVAELMPFVMLLAAEGVARLASLRRRPPAT